MELILITLAAVAFGFRDILKKATPKENKIINILMIQMLFSVIFSLTRISTFIIKKEILFIIIFKSTIILIAWFLGMYAYHKIPISIIAPFSVIRSILVLISSIFIFEQFLNLNQIIGFIVLSIGYLLYINQAKKEDVNLLKNKYFYAFLVACVLNVFSALIDKFLLESIDPEILQFYFYLFILIGYTIISIKTKAIKDIKIDNKLIKIFAMAFLLYIGDLLYFHSINIATINIGIISIMKRFSIIIAAIFGGKIFKEKNLHLKLIYILIILSGMTIMFLDKIH